MVRLVGEETTRSAAVRVDIEPRQERFEMRVDAGGRVRRLADGDCGALFRSAAVIAALLVEPARRAEAETASVAAEPAPAWPRSRPAASVGIVDEPDGPREVGQAEVRAPRATRLAVGVGVLTGLAPVARPWLELRAGRRHGSWGGALSAGYAPRARALTSGEAGLRIETLGGAAWGFYEPRSLVRSSVGLGAYRSVAEGVGVHAVRSEAAWSTVAVAELSLTPLRTASVFVELALTGRWVVRPARFEVAGIGEIYRAPRWGGGVAFRLGWDLE